MMDYITGYRRRLAVTMMIAMPVAVGCHRINKNRESGFLKPLTSPTSHADHQKMPSERTLCIETAKTVSQNGHIEEAIKLYRRAETLDPAADPLDAQLAPLFAQTGDHDAAIERYSRQVQTSTHDCDLSNNFAWTLMEAGRYADALAEANRGLAINPGHPRLSTTLAMIHYRRGDRETAQRVFQRTQGAIAAHHNLAILDIDAGNVEAASIHLQAARMNTAVPKKTRDLLAAFNQVGYSR